MTTLRALPLALLAALAGCSTVKIATEYDPAAPYASYKTYAWNAVAPGREQAAAIRNPVVRAQVIAAIEREMARKGLTKVPLDAGPDFFVAVLGASQGRVEVSQYGYGYRPATAFTYAAPGAYRTAVPVAVTEVRQYADGTLILDFVDAKTKQLFWRGTATDTVQSAEAVKATVDAAAKQLLDAYPPPKVEGQKD